MSIADRLDDTFDRIAHGIYSPSGRNIGWYDDLAGLAKQQAKVYSGETWPGWAEIRIKNGLGVLTPATTYLLSKGFLPTWLPEDQKSEIVKGQSVAATPTEVMRAAGVTTGQDPIMLVAVGAAVMGLVLLIARR